MRYPSGLYCYIFVASSSFPPVAFLRRSKWGATARSLTVNMHATIDRTGLPAETKLGIQLRGTDDGVLVIDMLSAGGLAEQIGELQNGDRILAINGNDVVGIPRNVIVGWLYEHDKTVVHYERDGPASTPSPPKMTMKERLKARAHRDSVNRGLPTGPVPSNTLGSRKTSLKTRLQSRRIEAEGKPEPASPPRAEPNFTTPPESPNGLNTSLPVSPSVIILGSSQTVEGIGAVHVIQVRRSSFLSNFRCFFFRSLFVRKKSRCTKFSKSDRKKKKTRSGCGARWIRFGPFLSFLGSLLCSTSQPSSHDFQRSALTWGNIDSLLLLPPSPPSCRLPLRLHPSHPKSCRGIDPRRLKARGWCCRRV